MEKNKMKEIIFIDEETLTDEEMDEAVKEAAIDLKTDNRI